MSLLCAPIPAQSMALAPSTPDPTSVTAGETRAPEPTRTALESGLILTEKPPASLPDRLARDPVGNSLAIVAPLSMLFSVLVELRSLHQSATLVGNSLPSVWIPALCLIGMGVAGYMAYVETAQVEAECGPVGDCNTVQQSEYACLFGVLPVGVLGLTGYLAVLLAWSGSLFGSRVFV